MRAWTERVSTFLVVVMLFGALPGCGHDPNHDINVEQARAAANRVHSPPRLSPADQEKLKQDHGG